MRVTRKLNSLYKGIPVEEISQNERKRLNLDEDAYICGEIKFLSFYSLLSKANPKSDEIFYDLGSGSGKAVLAAAAYFNFPKTCGIELLPALTTLSQNQLKKANLKNPHSIQFINDNFLNYDFTEADIIFVNATCLNYSTWENLVAKFKLLKKGSRLIVTTKKIKDEDFTLTYQGFTSMSWGVNTVNIYVKDKDSGSEPKNS